MPNTDLIIATTIFTILFIILVVSTLKEFHEMGKKGK
jgi:hypothetical protein